jgi:hypothetical protein
VNDVDCVNGGRDCDDEDDVSCEGDDAIVAAFDGIDEDDDDEEEEEDALAAASRRNC